MTTKTVHMGNACNPNLKPQTTSISTKSSSHFSGIIRAEAQLKPQAEKLLNDANADIAKYEQKKDAVADTKIVGGGAVALGA